jgi:hypothetical protein
MRLETTGGGQDRHEHSQSVASKTSLREKTNTSDKSARKEKAISGGEKKNEQRRRQFCEKKISAGGEGEAGEKQKQSRCKTSLLEKLTINGREDKLMKMKNCQRRGKTTPASKTNNQQQWHSRQAREQIDQRQGETSL